MAETQNGQSAEHLTIPSDSTIEGLFQDGVTVENGVRAEITGGIVGLIALREGSRLTIHGQAVGQLQIDVGAELTLVGLYAGTLAQSFDGALFASQGSTINRRVLLDGRFEEQQSGVEVLTDSTRLFRLTRADGSLATEEFAIRTSRPKFE